MTKKPVNADTIHAVEFALTHNRPAMEYLTDADIRDMTAAGGDCDRLKREQSELRRSLSHLRTLLPSPPGVN